MYLMDQVDQNCVRSFLDRQIRGPHFNEEQINAAQRLEVWASSFSDLGPDYTQWKLINEKRQIIAEQRVDGY